MFQRHDIKRSACRLYGKQVRRGCDRWRRSFTGISANTGRERSFYIEYFLVNPDKGGELPVFGQLPENQKMGPSYLMANAGAWGKNARQLHRFFGWKQVALDYGAPVRLASENIAPVRKGRVPPWAAVFARLGESARLAHSYAKRMKIFTGAHETSGLPDDCARQTACSIL